jgi:hypothetical protein
MKADWKQRVKWMFARMAKRTPEQIAKGLSRSGVKHAICGDANKCAISQAVWNKLPILSKPTAVVVTGGAETEVHAGGIIKFFDLPDSVQIFIKRFDRGEFPEIADEASVQTVKDFYGDK